MKSRHFLIILVIVLAGIVVVARTGILSRKNPGEPMSSARRSTMVTPQLSTEDALFIDQKYPTAHTTASGLRYVVLAPGEGPVAKQGQRLTTHYTGTLLNGKKFDSSRDRGEPFVLRLGVDGVITGWTEALGTMKKGERRLLIIPWWLAYGEKGEGDAIPAKATLLFDVEILDIN